MLETIVFLLLCSFILLSILAGYVGVKVNKKEEEIKASRTYSEVVKTYLPKK